MTESFASKALFDRFYYSRPEHVDGTAEFHELIRQSVGTEPRVLEVGAGPSNATSTFLGTLGSVTGVDVSDEVHGNTALTAATTYDGNRLPFANESFDACVSNFVLEHVENPEDHFREVMRVLRRGGTYVFRTPNRLHYVAGASSLLPHWVHLRLANRLRALSEEDHDPWKTFYRANRPGVIRRLAARVGANVSVLRMVEKEPSYARSSRVLFFPMMMYERLVNATDILANFRSAIFGVVTKPR
jgi:SAM-dependent methyltransferase